MNVHSDPSLMEDLLLTLIPGLVSGIPSGLFSIACYVLSSLALYTLASRRGIRKAWLSWIPVLNVWILGSLSDQYRYVVKGQIKSKRKILLAFNLTVFVLGLIVDLKGRYEITSNRESGDGRYDIMMFPKNNEN